jgi:hypothetical protein
VNLYSRLQVSALVLVSCLLGCAAAPAPSAAKEPAASEPSLEASVCEHMWTLQDSAAAEQRAASTAASAQAATACEPEVGAHRAAIGDEAFEREAACVMAATDADALHGCAIGPDAEPRELCEHVIALMQKELADSDAKEVDEAEVTVMLAGCMSEAGIERLTAEPDKWRAEVACVYAATGLEMLSACEPD